MRPAALDLTGYRALIGRELGVSAWHDITQAAIDAFAQLTVDQQFIHVDPVRARATALGGTVAHGFLTVSLLSHFAYQVVPPLAGGRDVAQLRFREAAASWLPSPLVPEFAAASP